MGVSCILMESVYTHGILYGMCSHKGSRLSWRFLFSTHFTSIIKHHYLLFWMYLPLKQMSMRHFGQLHRYRYCASAAWAGTAWPLAWTWKVEKLKHGRNSSRQVARRRLSEIPRRARTFQAPSYFAASTWPLFYHVSSQSRIHFREN